MSQKSLMVVKLSKAITRDFAKSLTESLRPVADAIGCEPVVAGEGVEVEVHRDLQPLIGAIKEQTAAVTKLAEQNQILISALLEDEARENDDGDEAAVATYLDGSPC